MISAEMTPASRDGLTIARIVRVNHAGEHGAIRIYRAQIAVARRLFPDIAPPLEEMLGHECRHCAVFRAAMPSRRSRPCRVMQLWGWGGYGLGLATALMGRQAVWICTAAVEAAVHRHLDDQLAFLAARDPELHAAIAEIREEEWAHLTEAEARSGMPTLFSRALRRVIGDATDALIWLSTWGDSARLARDLRTRSTAAVASPNPIVAPPSGRTDHGAEA